MMHFNPLNIFKGKEEKEEFPAEKQVPEVEKEVEEVPEDVDQSWEVRAKAVVEVWRLRMAIVQESRFIQDGRSLKRLQNQLTRFDKHYFPLIDQLGLQILDFTKREYETGLPVNPINLADFTADDEHLEIEVMMEPVIKKKGSADILHRGIVVLGRMAK